MGTAVRVGSSVSGIKVGDRVGVGAMIYSCGKCKQCTSDNENYCPRPVNTYVSGRPWLCNLSSMQRPEYYRTVFIMTVYARLEDMPMVL